MTQEEFSRLFNQFSDEPKREPDFLPPHKEALRQICAKYKKTEAELTEAEWEEVRKLEKGLARALEDPCDAFRDSNICGSIW